MLTMCAGAALSGEESRFIGAALKGQAVKKMEGRIRAAAEEALGGHLAQKYVSSVLSIILGPEVKLSDKANWGIYTICSKEPTENDQMPFCGAIIVLQVQEGSLLKEKWLPEFQQKRVGDWTLLAAPQDEYLLADDEVVQQIIADIGKSLDEDIVCFLSPEMCIQELDKLNSDELPPDVLMGKENLKDAESLFFSLRISRKNLQISERVCLKNDSKYKQIFAQTVKARPIFWNIIPAQNIAAAINISQNMTEEEMDLASQSILWQLNRLKNIFDKSEGACRCCCEQSEKCCCTESDSCSEKDSVDKRECACKCCCEQSEECCCAESDSCDTKDDVCLVKAGTCKLLRQLVESRDEVYDLTKLLLSYSTGDHYFAWAKSNIGYFCMGIKDDPADGTTFQEAFDGVAAQLRMGTAQKIDDYDGFVVYEIKFPEAAAKKVFCAIDGVVFLMACGTNEVQDLHDFIDLHRSGLKTMRISAENGIIGVGDINLAAIANGVLGDCFPDANLHLLFSAFIVDGDAILKLTIQNAQIRSLVEAWPNKFQAKQAEAE
ncbi:MAG: hypothetical protein LBI81_02630 [Puniceicoccales bacterium]|nr:hypothetical protein [Puniceicoccales bacterium]